MDTALRIISASRRYSAPALPDDAPGGMISFFEITFS